MKFKIRPEYEGLCHWKVVEYDGNSVKILSLTSTGKHSASRVGDVYHVGDQFPGQEFYEIDEVEIVERLMKKYE